MCNLICISGKSGSGKDTIARTLLKKEKDLKPLTLYTTRPMRPGEKEGKEYHFITDKEFDAMERENKFCAVTKYDTIRGIWKYGIPKDHILENKGSYLVIATPEQIDQISRNIKGTDINLEIFYIRNDEEKRIIKLFEREKKKAEKGGTPDYEEVIRRLWTDSFDFARDNPNMERILRTGQDILNDYVTTPDEIVDEIVYNYGYIWDRNYV